MRDELGDRMKRNYENRTRNLLPRRTYTIIRIDGKAFHTYTKGCVQPFDGGLCDDMDETAIYLCKNIQGAKFGYVQSDEISILVTDFDKLDTDAWFDGNIQKIVSVSASMATAKFNQLRLVRKFVNYDEDLDNIVVVTVMGEVKLAEFDARTFTIPADYEVENYFIWRQNDCVRNSISSVAQSHFSSKELNGKNMSEQQDMIHAKGDNWNSYDAKVKRGRFITKQVVELDTEFIDVDKMQQSYIRHRWISDECPTFTQDKEFLMERVPKL